MSDNWKQLYKEKLRTPDELAGMIDNQDKICSPTANGTPRIFWHFLAKRIENGELPGLELIMGLNLNAPDICKPEVSSKFYYRDGFTSPVSRKGAQMGLIDPTPMRFSDIPRSNIELRDYNVATFTASTMDKHGWFSVGLNASHAFSSVQRAKQNGKPMKIYLEVNNNHPFIYGHSHVHISEVTGLCEADWPLIPIPTEPPTREDLAIGAYIAEQIPDGSCIQLGIGGLPNAVGLNLKDKKDLGGHTEIIVESYKELYECGALTNRRKNFVPDRVVGTLVLGTKDLYDWCDHNKVIELHGVDFACNPYIAAQNDNFMTVNAIMECDLSGQCITDSQDTRQYSGMGGQQDFVQAGWMSKGGKSFLAMPSTFVSKDGSIQSKISPVVSGWIGINRWDVHYLVTEYGCVQLKGCGMRERVQKIVSIAHPDFRDWLVSEAKRLHLIDAKSDIDIKNMRKEI
ncbi:4-hydroxybutyrate coenzyme a transferase [hydrocarbon metagenome]|uniref:4-hydroxybutyrate coenzyme a transferase n=1 Tax=hydrocarbon metagenome TaxID=938273 RepID=A0A0W8E376_9ZZZZ